MGMPKRAFSQISRCAEKQGCEVTQQTGGKVRIKTPTGPVIVIHSSPQNVDNYLKQVRRKFIAAGLQPW